MSFLTCSMFIFRGARNVLWKSHMCSRNPPGLCARQIALVVARYEFWHCSHSPLNSVCRIARCGAVMVLAESLGAWNRDLMNSLECPSMTLLQGFHGAYMKILSQVWYRGPCEKMLRRSWRNPAGCPSISSMILCRTLSEDLATILLTSSKRSVHDLA